MKQNIRLLLLLSIIEIIGIKVNAQTLNIPATISWPLNLGTSGQAATYSTGTSDYFNSNWVDKGSNLIYKGSAINLGDTLTTFQPVVSSTAGDSTDVNLVSFNLRMNTSLSFKPTSVSLDCGRFGTDGGLVKIAWKSSDGTITMLQSNVKPNRVSASSTPPVYPTHLTYDLSSLNIPDSDGDCGLYFYIYSLGNTKTIGVGNVTINGSIASSKLATNITWSAPHPINYGTPLSNTQLNAIITGSTGAVTYTPAIGTIVNAGIQTLTVEVAPDDNYAGAKKTVTIEVYPEASDLTWSPPPSITYGTTLNTDQLKANVTGTTGTVTYIPNLDSILPAGTHMISVLFDADENHCPPGAITTITISKALSTITWDNPADIVYGAPLSATQLNATVTGTTGAATYTPALGTVLPTGTHTLTVTFSADRNYESVTKSVTINVTSPLSVETLTDADVIVFPNPVDNVVSVTVPAILPNSILTITTTSGKVILSKLLGTKTTEINVKDLPSGTYIFRISSGKNSVLKQVVKK